MLPQRKVAKVEVAEAAKDDDVSGDDWATSSRLLQIQAEAAISRIVVEQNPNILQPCVAFHAMRSLHSSESHRNQGEARGEDWPDVK